MFWVSQERKERCASYTPQTVGSLDTFNFSRSIMHGKEFLENWGQKA